MHASDQYIEKARRWLKPDGILVVDVPNYMGTDARKMWDHWTGWSLPYHFYHFTPETLKRLLANRASGRSATRIIFPNTSRNVTNGYFPETGRLIARFYSGHSFAVVAQKNGKQ